MKDLDEYIGAHVLMPGKDGMEVLCRVTGRKGDTSGEAIGQYNPNPILDTRIFQVEHPDGWIEEYARTNVIAESLLSNVNEEGYDIGWIEEIINHHKKENALSASEGFVMSGTTQKPVITTKGWDFQVRWKDGSTDWLPLSQVKESLPVELARESI